MNDNFTASYLLLNVTHSWKSINWLANAPTENKWVTSYYPVDNFRKSHTEKP